MTENDIYIAKTVLQWQTTKDNISSLLAGARKGKVLKVKLLSSHNSQYSSHK